jgi:dihydroorotase
VVLPLSLCNNSFPVIDNQSQVNFVQNKAIGVHNFFRLALTKGSEGKMAELFDMKNCGAIAFGDYNKSPRQC